MIDEETVTTESAAWDPSGAAGRVPGNNVHNPLDSFHILPSILYWCVCTIISIDHKGRTRKQTHPFQKRIHPLFCFCVLCIKTHKCSLLQVYFA